jgi:hypothetical protein
MRYPFPQVLPHFLNTKYYQLIKITLHLNTKQMKTIIRIEHNCGNGLWNTKGKYDYSLWRDLSFEQELNDKHTKFPTPKEENLTIEKMNTVHSNL